MRDKAAGIHVGRIHLVGQNVVFAQIKVWLGFAMRNVAVRWVGIGARRLTTVVTAARIFIVEPVHAAMSPGIAPGAVTRREDTRRSRGRYPSRFEPHRAQRNLATLGVVAELHGLGAGKAVEEVVEAAVLLDDDNDMANLAGRTAVVDIARSSDSRYRRRPAAATGAEEQRGGRAR